MTVTEGARRLGLSRQAIYTKLSRYKRFGRDGLLRKQGKKRGYAHNRTPKEVEELVSTLAEEYYMDGVESLADTLERIYGISLNPTTIWRILKRQHVRYGDTWKRTTKRWKIKIFAHDTPGMELQVDTCYPHGYKQGSVIYTAIDDASRFVYARLYPDHANATHTLDFIRRLHTKAPFPIQKIRTDQGKEFTALLVRDYLNTLGINHRRNTPYCPEENGKIERFHRTLKEKCIRPYMWPTLSFESSQ